MTSSAFGEICLFLGHIVEESKKLNDQTRCWHYSFKKSEPLNGVTSHDLQQARASLVGLARHTFEELARDAQQARAQSAILTRDIPLSELTAFLNEARRLAVSVSEWRDAQYLEQLSSWALFTANGMSNQAILDIYFEESQTSCERHFTQVRQEAKQLTDKATAWAAMEGTEAKDHVTESVENGPSAGRFFWGGNFVELTPTEYVIVKAMWEVWPKKGGKLCTNLSDEACRGDANGDAKAKIRPHVSRINKRLEELPGFKHRLKVKGDFLRWEKV